MRPTGLAAISRAGIDGEVSRMNEQDVLEVGLDAAWALWAENADGAPGNLGTWLFWRKTRRGARMAALYGFGEIRP